MVMKSTLSRLPLYYGYLGRLMQDGVPFVSSSVIADSLNLNPVLVRKDLAGVSSVPGRPRQGFEVAQLYHDLEEFLGYNSKDEAVLVGVGNLGRLLLTTKSFERLGLNIVTAFDKDENLHGLKINDKMIFPVEKMTNLIPRLNVKIGIIAVPEDQAQTVCDQLVASGILAIWNFAFTPLDVPKGILVKNENLAMSLANLSMQLRNKLLYENNNLESHQ